MPGRIRDFQYHIFAGLPETFQNPLPMNDQLEVLKLVARRLDDAAIAYMVSGSVAMNYYAEPRMTRDIDIVVELAAKDADRVAGLFGEEFYIDSEAVRDAIARRGMFNAIHTTLIVKVDFIVRKAEPYRLEEFSRRRVMEIEGVRVCVVAAEDLILSKLTWAKDSRSELQLRDVRNLIESVTDLDWTYINRWAAGLSVSDLLAEVRR